MKNQIILWSASIILTFLAGYFKAVTSTYYPLTGTFGIEGKKVSYKLDKIYYDQTPYENIVISDIQGLSGKIIMLNNDNQSEIIMSEIDRGLEAVIPVMKPGKNLLYKIVLNYEGRTYNIPDRGFVKLTFWGRVPSAVAGFYFFLLFGGLLLSIRSTMELFNKNKFLKKFAFTATTFFILNTILVNPLYNSYRLGALNKFVPSFTDLFDQSLIFISLSWIVGTILLFLNKSVIITTIAVGLVTIILFFLV
jgi:hypothetical protein